MSFNSSTFNEIQFNSEALPDGVIAYSNGNILSITQEVGLYSDGNILSLRQEVTFGSFSVGNICTIEQVVESYSSGNICKIIQIVTDDGTINPNPAGPIPSYIVRNGFYPIFTIGSLVWEDNTIHDTFAITQNEGDDRFLNFTLLLRKNSPYGPVDFESFEGATVTLDLYFLNGNNGRAFTGRINQVNMDVMKGSLSFTCIADRRNTIISSYYLPTQSIGYYDKDVLGEADDTFELLEKRLTTVPASVDVDRFGNLQYANLLPEATPHFTFTDGDVCGNNSQREAPRVNKLLRSRVVNTINIELTYQYQRRYHGNANYNWSWDTDTCEFLLEGESTALRSTIEAAAKSTGWVINPPGISYTEPPKNGLYNCSGQQIAYTTVKEEGARWENKTDLNGDPIKGPDGENQKTKIPGVFKDSRRLLAIGAAWRMSYRWVQNVQEKYTINLTAPQSIFRYGPVEQSMSAGVDDSQDNSSWEDYKSYKSTEDMEHDEDTDRLYYINHTPNRSRLYTAFNITMNQAKTTIIKAHRDNRVTFITKDIQPFIEMHHTVYLNCDRIKALGKVVRINHVCTVKGNHFSEIEIALCRAVGSAVDSALNAPLPPTSIPPQPEGWFINMGSIYGDEPGDNFRGFVGNKWKTEDDYTYGFRGTNTYKTAVDERFIVKAPDIEEVYRKLIELTANGSYTMSMPNNELEVSFL